MDLCTWFVIDTTNTVIQSKNKYKMKFIFNISHNKNIDIHVNLVGIVVVVP